MAKFNLDHQESLSISKIVSFIMNSLNVATTATIATLVWAIMEDVIRMVVQDVFTTITQYIIVITPSETRYN